MWYLCQVKDISLSIGYSNQRQQNLFTVSHLTEQKEISIYFKYHYLNNRKKKTLQSPTQQILSSQGQSCSQASAELQLFIYYHLGRANIRQWMQMKKQSLKRNCLLAEKKKKQPGSGIRDREIFKKTLILPYLLYCPDVLK